MERLTNRGTKGEIWITDNDETRLHGRKESAYRKLFDYEDKQEQGLLHEAKIKDGTPIWYCVEGFDEGSYVVCSHYIYNVTEYEIGEFGKKFWLTEAEAEEALAKMGE